MECYYSYLALNNNSKNQFSKHFSRDALNNFKLFTSLVLFIILVFS